MKDLVWVEISKEALAHNIKQFRSYVGDKILCPCVKANAYGHGLVDAAKVFVENGADWLSVNSLYEASGLRNAGIEVPIYILGYTALQSLKEAVDLDCRQVVYNEETVKALGVIGKPVKIHLKVETGNNRQGILISELADFVKLIKQFPNIELEGLASHFANIEDTTDHSYAEKQLARFNEAYKILESMGVAPKIRHCANSAATLLFRETHFEMVRPGIACYGMWPSNETYLSFLKEIGSDFSLKPAFAWKSKVAQIKEIATGEYIGYGCTFKTSHPTRLAIIPVGYYDGYDRSLNGAYVLINGRIAPVRGRVCMNIIMVEVTDIPDAKLENEVVLLGKNCDEEITAEQFGSWAGTINYEVTTRVNERIPRIIV